MKQLIQRLSGCSAIIKTSIFSQSKIWIKVVAGVVLSGIIALKVTGQATLPSFVNIQNHGVTDYIIPNNVVELIVTVAGAQGG